ncbi:MAG TPA: ATP-binding protein [Polyangiaceae bacterium]|nr:ATP-binding protein [Polyangiaceae bacterium]
MSSFGWMGLTRGGSFGLKGSGLGLYIAAGIVNAHGGRIWAQSEPGVGTTMAFTLPRSDAVRVRASGTLTLGQAAS